MAPLCSHVLQVGCSFEHFKLVSADCVMVQDRAHKPSVSCDDIGHTVLVSAITLLKGKFGKPTESESLAFLCSIRSNECGVQERSPIVSVDQPKKAPFSLASFGNRLVVTHMAKATVFASIVLLHASSSCFTTIQDKGR